MNTVNHLLRLRFCTWGYSDKEVKLKGDAVSVVRIKYYPRLYWIGGQEGQPGEWDRSLLEEFANSSGSPEEILRFTGRYGPLEARLRGGEKRRTTFKICDWQRLQREYKDKWEGLRLRRGRLKLPMADLPVVAGEQFDWWFSRLSYHTANLHRLLLLELYSTPRHRLKKCIGQDCETPFFIADHLSRRYCKACKQRARLESKRKSWRKHDGWR